MPFTFVALCWFTVFCHRCSFLSANGNRMYSAAPLNRGKFSQKYSQKTPHSSPVRSRYWVSFVVPASYWQSASVPVIIYVISDNVEPRYNGTRLYTNQIELQQAQLITATYTWCVFFCLIIYFIWLLSYSVLTVGGCVESIINHKFPFPRVFQIHVSIVHLTQTGQDFE